MHHQQAELDAPSQRKTGSLRHGVRDIDKPQHLCPSEGKHGGKLLTGSAFQCDRRWRAPRQCWVMHIGHTTVEAAQLWGRPCRGQRTDLSYALYIHLLQRRPSHRQVRLLKELGGFTSRCEAPWTLWAG